MVDPDVPPVLQNIPSDQVVQATSPFGAVVNFALPTASDPSDPNVQVICVPASGSTFPFGTTEVTCTATDQAGNVARATFTINVRDDTPPAIVAPNLVVQATGPTGALVNFTSLQVTDAADPDPVVQFSRTSGSLFPIGTTPVTCTAMDRSGNVSTATFLVTVQDTPVLQNPPPSLVVPATSAAGAVVKFKPPTATDVADPHVQVVVSRPSGSRFPIGTTVVTCTARGLSSATAAVTFTVTVVPGTIVGSVATVAQAALGRAATALGDPPSASGRSGQKLTVVTYGPNPPAQGAAASAAVAFLSRVASNSDFQVTLKEMTTFLAANVDLNHDGKISRYELARYQLRDPQGSQYLAPGG
jgi:hypothetical protein